MRAVAFRIAASLRRRWPSALAVLLLVAVASGTVLTLLAGARRTATAPDRLTAADGGDPDALVIQQNGTPRTAEIGSLPAVANLESFTFVAVDLEDPAHPGSDLNPFAGNVLPGSRLVEGRLADPAVPFEFVANLSFVAAHDAAVGDHFTGRVYTQDQLERNAFEEPAAGATFEATMVGIIDSPADLDDPSPSVGFSPALLDQHPGVVTTFMVIDLAPGTTISELRAEVDGLPGGADFGVDFSPIVSREVRTSVDAQAKGLWVIAIVAGLAVVVALGQLVTRQVRLADRDRSTLTALGTSRRQLLLEPLGAAAVPVVGGVLVGTGLAALASGVFPTGFVHRLERRPGLRPDAVILGLGGLTIAAVLLAWITVALLLQRVSNPGVHRSRWVEAVAGHVPAPGASTGVRFGLGRRDREAVSAVGTTAGLVLAVAGLVGAAVFSVSLRELVRDGDRYGNNFDLVVGNGWLPPMTDLRVALADDPDIAGLMLLGTGFARHGDLTVELIGAESVRGGLLPRALEGRLPTTDDEIALGRLTAHRLGARIGDTLELQTDAGPAALHVVGLAVVPSLGINEGVGKGAVLAASGLRRLAPDSIVNAAGIVLAPSADTAAARARIGAATSSTPSTGMVPAAIRNIGRLERVPVILTVLLAGLGVITLVHTLVTSVRSRRRDLAVLRVIGADRGLIGRVVAAQVTSVALVPLVIGVPLGLLAGRLVARAFAERIGAIADPATPVALGLLLVVGVLGVANVSGAISARRATRLRPAAVLRSE